MLESISQFFNSDDFLPHGHCFDWDPTILWVHVVSDAVVAFAYYLIPLLLLYLVGKRQDLPYRGVFAAFCAFILLCGTTHVMSIWVLWYPDYAVEGVIKALTAVASITGLFILWKTVPRALTLINPLAMKQRASENRMHAVVDNALDGLVTLTKQGIIESFNPASERIFGYRSEEVLGQNFKLLIPDLYYHSRENYIEDYLTMETKTGSPSDSELNGKRKDGTRFPMDLSLSAFDLDDGRHFSGIIRDITERKRTEEALVESEKKLQQSQKMEAIGNLTGGMAHDFNNLLGIIIGNLDLVLDRAKENKDIAELTQSALDSALRGADLTRRLLAFARKQPLHSQRIIVNPLITELMKLLSRTLGENIQITLDLAPDLWPVRVDSVQLEAALTNLATNARDAMPRGGRLMITTNNMVIDSDYVLQHPDIVQGDYTMIAVTDTGVGMPADIAERIFEPFFTTKERGKGTGLGLSMVFGFIKQSGGHINVYSEVGTGTTFRLFLPRIHEAMSDDTKTSPIKGARGGHETILVVEDNGAMRQLVVRQLSELGYHVLQAEDANAAMAVLAENKKINLLFTDIVMPGVINGMELANQAMERWPSLKVLLTSGFPENRLNDNEEPTTGGLHLLSKPYRKEELARTIRAILDHQH